MFEELLVDQDHDDLAIRVTGESYTGPIRDRTFAANAHHEQPDPPSSESQQRFVGRPWKRRLGRCARTVMTADKSSLS
jgi:hypothetical protein